MAAHRTAEPSAAHRALPRAEWRRLVDGRQSGAGRRPPSVRRVIARFVVANLLAVAVLLAGSLWASYAAASKVSVADAGTVTDLVARTSFGELSDGVLAGDAEALDELDRVVEEQLKPAGVVRVKIWDADASIVYSDKRELIGRPFEGPAEELAAIRNGGNSAQVSDLNDLENFSERSEGEKLVEVYRAIESPSGERLVLETYFDYDQVTTRQNNIWWTIAPISVAVLLLLVTLQVPLARRMIRQLRMGDEERLLLHARAADASAKERRRIAGSLHDGIVQDLAAAALVMTHANDRLHQRAATPAENEQTARDLDTATGAVRQSLSSLRSLLIEIYPPHLAKAGLASALADLVTRLQARGVQARLDVPDDLEPPPNTAAVLFRIAQEALLNVAKHARATSAEVVLRSARGFVTMEIRDDGVGFDPAQGAAAGHFGLQVLADLTEDAGGTLDLATAPGAGTALWVRIPVGERSARI